MKYYTSGCADWRWTYNYSYPPLMTDLVRYIPSGDSQFIQTQPYKPLDTLVSLAYVLPQQNLNLLPDILYKSLLSYRGNWYKTDCDFIWAYKSYISESHVELPHIDINELEKFVKYIKQIYRANE